MVVRADDTPSDPAGRPADSRSSRIPRAAGEGTPGATADLDGYPTTAQVPSEAEVRVPFAAGATLRVVVRGEGPPVLLIHGFTGSAASWGERILSGLAGSHRVIAVDLPGHGGSDPAPVPDGYALKAVVDALTGVLDHAGVRRAHWLGYSMGGRVALGAAVLAPNRVDRLVLESASPGLESEEERRARRAQDEELARLIEGGGVAEFVEAWAGQPLFSSQDRLPAPVLEAQRRRRLANHAGALAACLRGLGTGSQPSMWARLSEVRAPVLLLTGDLDGKFGELADRMARALPDAFRVGVPSAGHAVHLEAAEAWLEIVSSWLDPARAPIERS